MNPCQDVVHLPPPVARIVGVDSVAYCAEEWGNKYSNGRLIYSIFIFIVQVIPRSLFPPIKSFWEMNSTRCTFVKCFEGMNELLSLREAVNNEQGRRVFVRVSV